MWVSISLYLVLGAAVFTLWYALSARAHRKRAVEIMRWIESALVGQGHVSGIRWVTPSTFHVKLRMGSNIFQRARMVVRLAPREMPIKWLMSKLRAHQDTVTFEADLDFRPSFNLDVHNFRWFARTSKNMSLDTSRWSFDTTGPFVLTSRMEWEREITQLIQNMITAREREFLNIRYGKSSPHFSATVALDSLSPRSELRYQVFTVIKELAGGAGATSC